MIRKILHSHVKTITSGAIIIASTSLASRILGILRDRILASEFGAGAQLDMYYAAFRIPDTMYNLLVLGAISAGFIPVFLDCIHHQGKKNCWRLVNNLLNIMVLILLAFSLLFFFFAPYIIKWITPGFSLKDIETTVFLTRIMFLSPLFLGISSIFGGILQSFKQFFIYSLAPIFYNIGIIMGALYMVPQFGVAGLAYGVVLGAFLHMIIQLPAVYESGYRYRFSLHLKDANVQSILKLMVPRTLSLAVNQLNLFIVTFFGSMLTVGSIAIFNLANNLQSFPLGIFGISLAIAAFPTLAEFATKKQTPEFLKSFSHVVRQILFFIIPASALLIVFRAQIVRVVLGAGVFGWKDTIMTADALAFFSLSLFAQALIPLLSRGFYAFQNTKSPLYVGVFSVLFNGVLSYIAVRSHWVETRFSPVVGLVMAFSLSQIVNFVLLWVLLRLQLKTLHEAHILSSIIKTSVATVFMAITIQMMKFVVASYTGTDTFIGVMLQAIGAGGVGIFVFVLMCILLRSEEMHTLVSSVKKRIFRESQPVREAIEEAEK